MDYKYFFKLICFVTLITTVFFACAKEEETTSTTSSDNDSQTMQAWHCPLILRHLQQLQTFMILMEGSLRLLIILIRVESIHPVKWQKCLKDVEIQFNNGVGVMQL